MNTQREARRDAREYARAQMYYGEGAGNRRKLIDATVQSKVHRDPEYRRAFREEYSKQDMAEHARQARKERRHTDIKESATKDARALVRGDYRNVRSGILVIAMLGYVAHQTGLDKVALEKGKVVYADVKTRIKIYRAKKKLHSVD